MSARVFLYLNLFFCLWLPFWSAAVQPYAPVIADPILEPWRWKHEEVLDGLSVICMDEAPDGSLWFGTIRSVVHYDGIQTTEIPFDDTLLSKITNVSGAQWAKALVVMKDGNPLILFGESLVLWTGSEWKVVLQETGPSNFSSRMEMSDDGTVWLFVSDRLWRISGDLLELTMVIESSETRQFKTMCLSQAGAPWILLEQTTGSHALLIHIPLRDGKPVPKAEWKEVSVPDREVMGSECCIVEGLDGLIWYVDNSRTAGLEAFDPRRGVWISRENATPPRTRYSLSQCRDGTLWSGAEGHLLRLSPQREEVFYSNGQLQLLQVPLTVYETRNGRLWVVERLCNVYSVDVGTYEWMTYEGLTFQCETVDGVQWFLSKTRRHAISHDTRSGKWLQYGTEDGLIDRTDLLMSSSHGLIWVAGRHEGRAAVSVFDGKRWVRHCHPEFAQWIEPNSGFEAADGTVWFGAGGGQLADSPNSGGAIQYAVDSNREVRVIRHHAPPDFPYYVTALTQTPDNTIWVGSTWLHRYDGSSSEARLVSGLPGANTVDMVLDHGQTLWGAKDNFGVFRQKGDSWELFTQKDGVAGSLLSSLLVLDDGSILASSDRGVSRFDGKTWQKHVYPEWFSMAKRWSGLRKSADGSIWLNMVNEESQPAQILLSQSERYRTVRHRPETNAPDTQITDYLEKVSQPGNSHMVWTGHDPWSSTPAEELQYSWRMDGGEWSAFSQNPGKTFLNLASGWHILEVRARDRAFNIDSTPDRAEFRVIPPIWRQAWFVALISILSGLIVSLVWILIKTREQYLIRQQAEHEAFLMKQQEEREKNLLERQQERETLLVKQQEEKERHLEEMDRVKTGFFTNISHELRTPMTVITGRLETVFTAETDEKTKKALSIVLRNAQRVTTLITQLLDFRKIQEGKIRVEPTHGDLIPPLRDWAASLQVLAEQARISLSLDIPETFRGNFDFDKLQKIFTNLIANAIKYTKASGEVRVVLGNDADNGGEQQLRFTVEDTGVGIPAEHLGQIFDRFYRVSEASMAVGAGIGLNLTKELVELLGGTIQVESPIHSNSERPGSRFTVRLPMEQVASGEGQVTGGRGRVAGGEGQVASGKWRGASGEGQESASSDPSKLPDPVDRLNPPSSDESPLILIVEDDEDIRNFITEGLVSTYRVDAAKNGEEGLQKAKETVPDLIVTDVMMPVMDGVELCRELKTSLETSHIPVVMLTAKASLEHQLEGLKTGADDYITKPFHMELLQARIANLLESRRLLREQFLREYPVLTPVVPENTPDREFLEKIRAVLEENYSEWEFNPDQFASQMNMSLRSLYRKLKATADRTPAGFISEFRMMRAAELLLTTSHTVTEIAFQVGCDESTNFARLFKAHYGVSPSQYRSGQRSS